MNIYIALLRGINVSGQKKVPMADLRELLTKSGFESVQTYIQSGNVIFKSEEKDVNKLESKIHEVIQSHFGFEVSILIKTPEGLEQILKDCPFPEEKKVNSYFMLMFSEPNKDLIEGLGDLNNLNEEIVITDACIYFYSETGYGRTKYNNNFFERKLKVTATARNYKTMVKLLSLCID